MTLETNLLERFPACYRTLGDTLFRRLAVSVEPGLAPEGFADFLAVKSLEFDLPPYIAQLAELELAYYQVRYAPESLPEKPDRLLLNPSLRLVPLAWRNVTPLLFPLQEHAEPPQSGEEFVLIWRHPTKRRTRVKVADSDDLLVLKILAEEIDRQEAARLGDVPVGVVDAAFFKAAARGLILEPPSRVERTRQMFPVPPDTAERFVRAGVFSLQWHVTQQCDLHCKHCYDRSKISPLRLAQGLDILDQLREFALARHARGQVTFTGGNPLLYKDFMALYQGAADRGLSAAILGNPAGRDKIEQIAAIQKPLFYQVSLEGLREHNDEIRGPGHFDRVLEFLRLLRELKVPSMVMLTLTDKNIDQVIALTEILREKTDDFTFNRLSPVGEGANLQLPGRDTYAAFLAQYLQASRDNPIIGLKDGLLNIIRHHRREPLFGGCCGVGCGAAFNFLCVLPDGEVHACRKFPSPVGHLMRQSLTEIYESPAAARYRAGCTECVECVIRPVCGGCLAMAHGMGLDFSEHRDPFCFID